jgi:hypothetical protein
MIQTAVETTILSEIFPLLEAQNAWKENITAFKVSTCDQEDFGNRLAYHLSRLSPCHVVIYQKKVFWVLAHILTAPGDLQHWQRQVENVRPFLEDIGDTLLQVEMLTSAQPNARVRSELAVAVIEATGAFESKQLFRREGVEVRQVASCNDEVVVSNAIEQPGIMVGIKCIIQATQDLSHYWQEQPASVKGDPAALLVGLPVYERDKGNSARIHSIVGTVGEHRERLLGRATGEISRHALERAEPSEPLVGVCFGKSSREYHYALGALRMQVTAQTVERFGVTYGQMLAKTKLPYVDRTQAVSSAKEKAIAALEPFGISLARAFNSKSHPELFRQSGVDLESTPLLFGNGHQGIRSKVLSGLKRGGVFSLNPQHADSQILVSVFKLNDGRVKPFFNECVSHLKRYGFECQLATHRESSISNLRNASDRALLEQQLDELLAVPADVVLVFLPTDDRDADDDEGGSLYHYLYSRLLRRGIASQFVYADTLSSNAGQILNQVVPAIIAKIGHLPFVLAEPLEIADLFVGLDISRTPHPKRPGSINALGSVCLYGKQGEFIQPATVDMAVNGEEIPIHLLEALLPASQVAHKTVLIYRDGPFRGNEVSALLEWGQAVKSQFVLVEVIKSGVPRLYQVGTGGILTSPNPGVGMYLSEHSSIMVMTGVIERVGLARPLRLQIRPEGKMVPLKNLVDVTSKLTLLHHGSLRTPRLPMPLHGAHKIAALRLKGIAPLQLVDGRQFWL